MTDDWTLTPIQALYMLRNHNAIQQAFTADDMDALRKLETAPEYREMFGEMSFDEAYDRWLTMQED